MNGAAKQKLLRDMQGPGSFEKCERPFSRAKLVEVFSRGSDTKVELFELQLGKRAAKLLKSGCCLVYVLSFLEGCLDVEYPDGSVYGGTVCDKAGRCIVSYLEMS
jgi:hypothetical protein